MTMTLDDAYFVLKVQHKVPTVVSVHDEWTVAVSHQLALTDYVVRQYGDTDGLVRQALTMMNLSPQRERVLMELYRWSQQYPHRGWVTPSRPGDGWRGMDSTDMVAPALVLVERGLVRRRGVRYGPKSYRLSRLGRMMAEHVYRSVWGFGPGTSEEER